MFVINRLFNLLVGPFLLSSLEEEDIDSLNYRDLQARCADLGLNAGGKAVKLRQRLKDRQALLRGQVPGLSDIDEEGESESIISRRSIRGRSVDEGSRELSDLSARSLSRGRGSNEIGRRRSHSAPRTPINDILLENSNPYDEESPLVDRIVQRLTNNVIEGKNDDRYGEVVKHQVDLYKEVGSMKKFREYANSSLNSIKQDRD
jgi:hypothetical protein